MKKISYVILILVGFLPLAGLAQAQRQRWTEAKANAWYAQQPWLVGANYVPATAANQLEMWQADTFDPQQIDKELGWAENTGMNMMRVFLPYILWIKIRLAFSRELIRS